MPNETSSSETTKTEKLFIYKNSGFSWKNIY